MHSWPDFEPRDLFGTTFWPDPRSPVPAEGREAFRKQRELYILTLNRDWSKSKTGPVAPTMINGWPANSENIIPTHAVASSVSETPIKLFVLEPEVSHEWYTVQQRIFDMNHLTHFLRGKPMPQTGELTTTAQSLAVSTGVLLRPTNPWWCVNSCPRHEQLVTMIRQPCPMRLGQTLWLTEDQACDVGPSLW